MTGDLIERLKTMAADMREYGPFDAAKLLDEAATALATEREAREKAEKERDELLLALDRCPAGPVELRAQLSYDRHRADTAEASLAEARRLLKPFADTADHFDGHVRDDDTVEIAMRNIRAHHVRAVARFLSQEAER
jgi:hypothetical protein